MGPAGGTSAQGLTPSRPPWPPVRGTEPRSYQVLVVEQVHHAGGPLPHGDQVRGRAVETQQTQRCTLLHTVHGVPGEQSRSQAASFPFLMFYHSSSADIAAKLCSSGV